MSIAIVYSAIITYETIIQYDNFTLERFSANSLVSSREQLINTGKQVISEFNLTEVLLGTYEYDGSKLYLNTLDDKIYYCDRYDATPLKSWDSLSAMLTSEIERIFGLFDADGHCIDEDVPTTPVVI
jgi:hypothetical protein